MNYFVCQTLLLKIKQLKNNSDLCYFEWYTQVECVYQISVILQNL